MEILYAHALLCAAGLAPEEAYTSCLHAQFLGRSLMSALRPAYAAASDLQHFTDHLYILWSCLPTQLSQEQPFWALSYAGEPLSWGDEAQARQLCHTMLRHYDPT